MTASRGVRRASPRRTPQLETARREDPPGAAAGAPGHGLEPVEAVLEETRGGQDEVLRQQARETLVESGGDRPAAGAGGPAAEVEHHTFERGGLPEPGAHLLCEVGERHGRRVGGHDHERRPGVDRLQARVRRFGPGRRRRRVGLDDTRGGIPELGEEAGDRAAILGVRAGRFHRRDRADEGGVPVHVAHGHRRVHVFDLPPGPGQSGEAAQRGIGLGARQRSSHRWDRHRRENEGGDHWMR